MGFFFLKNSLKPRRFNHVPIYWDPEKEKLEHVEEKYNAEQKNIDGEYKTKIQRGAFRKYSDRMNMDEQTKQRRKLMYKLIFVLVVLFILLVYLLKNGGMLFSLYFDSGF